MAEGSAVSTLNDGFGGITGSLQDMFRSFDSIFEFFRQGVTDFQEGLAMITGVFSA